MRVIQAGKAQHWLVFLVFAAGLPGCGCVLKEPLSDADKAKIDERLFGPWKIDDPDKKQRDYGIVAIGKADLQGAPAGILKFVALGNDGNDKLRIDSLCFFITSLGTENYANILNHDFMDKDSPKTWEKARTKDWCLLKYSLENDRLSVWLVNNEALEEAITQKELKGTIEEKGAFRTKSITITDSKDFVRFLTNGGDKRIFTDKTKQVFSRIK
jgi:hypothetical protein